MKNLMMNLIPIILLLTACSNDSSLDENPSVLTSIEIISESTSFIKDVDQTTTLEAIGKDANGNILENVNFQWSSSDSTIATINNEGLLTIINVGEVTITVSSSSVTATIDITIHQDEIVQIRIIASDTDITLGSLNSTQYSVEALGSVGQVLGNPSVDWSSNDLSVIMVGISGTLNAIAVGQAQIQASYQNFTDSVSVNVIPPSESGDYIFISDNTQLVGTISLPEGDGPFPSIVMVHGSGNSPRSIFQPFVDVFTSNGIAVLFYDKRGTGQSDGVFFELNVFQNGIERVNQLGRDVIAAVEFMKLHTKTQEVGVFGWSQAGWINPKAVVYANNNLDFMINIVGPVCSVGEEIYYSSLTTAGVEIENANSAVYGFNGIHGYDPIPDLEQITIPSLWALGGQDASIPTAVSIQRLNFLINDGKPFELYYYPNGNHSLFDVVTGQQILYISGEGGAIDWIMDTVGN